MLGAGLGLVMGTFVVPNRIDSVFSLVFTPLLFTGCSQYPRPSLSRLEWFQAVTAINPMTYVSEMMRAALVPQVPYIAPWVCLVVLAVALLALMTIGVRGFYRARSIERLGSASRAARGLRCGSPVRTPRPGDTQRHTRTSPRGRALEQEPPESRRTPKS